MAKYPRNAHLPWLLDMPEADYHKDPSPTPSLSSSIAKLLVNESPYHAYRQHPRLRKQSPLPSEKIACPSFHLRREIHC